MATTKEIEIPFGAKDSELCGWEYTIPEGMEAEIKDGKIIVREKESEDERVRKELLKHLKEGADGYEPAGGSEDYKRWLIWFEKQGEQKQDVNMQINPSKYINDMGGNGCYLKNTTQVSTWSEEDEEILKVAIESCEQCGNGYAYYWLKSIKDRVQPQNLTVTDKELARAKKDAYNDALDKIEYHSDTPTFDDGWSAAIWYLKKRNAQPQNTWKPSDAQMKLLREVQQALLGKDCHNRFVNFMYELKRLREE